MRSLLGPPPGEPGSAHLAHLQPAQPSRTTRDNRARDGGSPSPLGSPDRTPARGLPSGWTPLLGHDFAGVFHAF
jgi:hypothetical protein